MLFLASTILLLLTTTALAHPVSLPKDNQKPPQDVPSRHCGTAPPSPHLVAAHQNLSDPAMAARLLSRRVTPKITVNTYFHIVSTTDQAHAITAAMVANQFGALQQAYASSAISFVLKGTTWTVNNLWATDADDSGMKSTLRQGRYADLNVYFQTNLSASNSGSGSFNAVPNSGQQLLGYCTLPSNVTYLPCPTCAPVEFPSADYASDGCNVLAGTMPSGSVYGYNKGLTAVHEIGHWFGLLHTFQDGSCSSGDSGDFIADTPQQSTATSGCPTGKDSCPGSPGKDVVWNFMDYSSDACYTGFTSNQVDRMQNMFQQLRYGE
ncbi:hypothetical protein MMC30_006870 [Trapelia coarctata]|nr:hypothetical protein [Trapelia coarctata]